MAAALADRGAAASLSWAGEKLDIQAIESAQLSLAARDRIFEEALALAASLVDG